MECIYVTNVMLFVTNIKQKSRRRGTIQNDENFLLLYLLFYCSNRRENNSIFNAKQGTESYKLPIEMLFPRCNLSADIHIKFFQNL